ncbi:hypothetical protein [Microbacterium rhizomatis]|uniref:CPBP family intramembrane metalloprotease n=1 Tax=Microbacterium rhizomatis TaxID=1631477 RepID=A0A5J5J1T2_9MICO|nr:hypothetical protein [Microbacterium rhizomatis]KAA9107954.1 hypothetical protein F6B43_11050 [Microbacterium rhizomatis]
MSIRASTTSRRYGIGILAVSLLMRLVLFAVFQAIVALLVAASGAAQPWPASAALWPFTAAATSGVTFIFLRWRGKVEGFAWTGFYRFVRPGAGKDLLWALVVAVIGGTLAVAGSILLAPVFFTDPLTANALLIQPLPTWAAVVAIIVFPVTVALTELPLYFGYAQPRIAALTGSAWLAVLLPSLFLRTCGTTPLTSRGNGRATAKVSRVQRPQEDPQRAAGDALHNGDSANVGLARLTRPAQARFGASGTTRRRAPAHREQGRRG